MTSPIGYRGRYDPTVEYKQKRYSPASIWARLAPGTLGIPAEAVQIPTKELKNQADGAMLVDSITFIPGVQNAITYGPLENNPGLGGAFGVRINLGSVPLTDGYVPVWCFAPMMPQIDEQIGLSALPSADRLATTVFNVYKWRLPQPIYLPRSGALDMQVSVKNNGALATSAYEDLEFNVLCEGRIISPNAPPPPMVDVPWVAHWDGPVVNDVLATSVFKSPETSLANPHAEPVFVERMLSRAWSTFGGSTPMDATYYGPADSGGNPSNYVPTITLKDSLGHIMLRDPLSPALAFLVDASWEMGGAVMPPRSYWKMVLNYPPYNFTAPFQNQFALVGHRRVDYRTLGLASTN